MYCSSDSKEAVSVFSEPVDKSGEKVTIALEDYDPVMQYDEAAANLSTETLEQISREAGKLDLSSGNERNFATSVSCKIDGTLGYVKFSYELPGIPNSDDDKLYLFELETYESSHGDTYIATSTKQKNGCFIFAYNRNRLFDKYVMAVKKNGEYVDICIGQYITNPEAVASYTYAYPNAASIKGLIVDPYKVNNGSLTDLGVKQAAYNIPIAFVLGETTSGNYPTIRYNYNGKTYAINGQRIAEFDIIFKALTKQGIVTTAVLLNNKGAYSQTIHPNSWGGTAPYYMFNAANEDGCQALEAVATFLAERYSGTEHGQIVNWVVGNEVNARAAWNYMDYTDVNTYTEEYVKSYRLFYNAIKSINANARVYMCIDQVWDRNLKSTDGYDAKDVLDVFNNSIVSRGNIDYGIAHHSYPVPLTWPKFWDMPSNYKSMNLVQYNYGTPFITIQNINILTDYIQQSNFLNPNGEVRSVLINEIGFGSDHGETLQAACFAYAYYIADANQYIDGFIINKQTDNAVEIAQGLSMGLDYSGGGHKYIYNVFKYIDTASSYDVTAFAKDIIGISDWSQVITKY